MLLIIKYLLLAMVFVDHNIISNIWKLFVTDQEVLICQCPLSITSCFRIAGLGLTGYHFTSCELSADVSKGSSYFKIIVFVQHVLRFSVNFQQEFQSQDLVLLHVHFD